MCRREAVEMIQRFIDRKEMICQCHLSKSHELVISYFTPAKTSIKAVCMDDDTVRGIVKQHFMTKFVMIPKEWNEKIIDDYLQEMLRFCEDESEEMSVLITKETDQYLIFGLRKPVEALLAAQEKLKKELLVVPCQLDFEEYQVRFVIELSILWSKHTVVLPFLSRFSFWF